MKTYCTFIILLLALGATNAVWAQDDALDALEQDMAPTKDFQQNTFGSTRVINAHSSETQPQGSLDFRISHRFGPLSDGPYGFFGLDQATMRIAFEYGITNRLLAGIGRSNWNKTYDGFLKYKLLWQAKGRHASPVTLDYFVNVTDATVKPSVELTPYYYSHRLSFAHQLIIARKFNKSFSFELLPTYIHRNFVDATLGKNDVYALGAATRIRLNNIFAIDAEYFYVLPGEIPSTFKNSLSIGLDIKVGAHEFQMAFSNSLPMIEQGFIAQTTEDWAKAGIHFGFNLSRVFDVGPHPKKK